MKQSKSDVEYDKRMGFHKRNVWTPWHECFSASDGGYVLKRGIKRSNGVYEFEQKDIKQERRDELNATLWRESKP